MSKRDWTKYWQYVENGGELSFEEWESLPSDPAKPSKEPTIFWKNNKTGKLEVFDDLADARKKTGGNVWDDPSDQPPEGYSQLSLGQLYAYGIDPNDIAGSMKYLNVRANDGRQYVDPAGLPGNIQPYQAKAIADYNRGFMIVPNAMTTDADGNAVADPYTQGQYGSLKPGDKITIDANGWYKIPGDAKDIRMPSGGYHNVLTDRYTNPNEKPTNQWQGQNASYTGETPGIGGYLGKLAKMVTGSLQGEPGGGKDMSELQAASWFIGKVAAMGMAAGGGGEVGTGDFNASGQEITAPATYAYGEGWGQNAGTGDFDPATGEEIKTDPNTAYGSGYKSGPSNTDIAMNYGKKTAMNVGKSYLIKSLTDGQDGSGGGEQETESFGGFNIGDTPLSTEFSDNEKIIDDLLKAAGKTGDLKIATEAVNSFQTIATNRTEIETEIQKFKTDPNFEVMEPEIRATTEEAIQKGMSPKQATAYAFEKAKKERAASEFMTEFKMRKKLELAGISESEDRNESPVLYDPNVRIEDIFRKQGVSL